MRGGEWGKVKLKGEIGMRKGEKAEGEKVDPKWEVGMRKVEKAEGERMRRWEGKTEGGSRNAEGGKDRS